MGQVDPVRLGDQPKQLPVAVEAPWPTGLADFQGGLAVPVKEHDAWLSGGVFVGELDCGRTVPLDVNYRDEAIRQDSLNSGTAREIFALGHRWAAAFASKLRIRPKAHDITLRRRLPTLDAAVIFRGAERTEAIGVLH